MDGFSRPFVRAPGAEPTVVGGSFALNSTADPVPASNRYPLGVKFVVSRTGAGTGVGILTVTFPTGTGMPNFPKSLLVSAQSDVAADWFDVQVLGEGTLNAAGKTFTVFTHRNGTPTDVAANAGSRVNFLAYFDNSTGA